MLPVLKKLIALLPINLQRKKNSIFVFSWQGINDAGQRLNGKLFGQDASAIQLELRQQKIAAFEIRKIQNFSCFTARLSQQQLVLFCRHLANLLTAGMSLVPAIDIMSTSSLQQNLLQVLFRIKLSIASGRSFHESLADQHPCFDQLFISLVKIGERSGNLVTLLQRLAENIEKQSRLHKKIQQALYYPMLVITMTCLIAVLLLVFTLPKFELLFIRSGVSLPLLTRFFIQLFVVMHRHYLEIALILTSILLLFKNLKPRFRTLNNFLDKITFKLPIFGKLIKKIIMARIARTFSTLLSGGVPIIETLETVASVTNNSVYTKAILVIRHRIAAGEQLHSALKSTQLFPGFVTQLITIGEQCGNLTTQFNNIADSYEAEIDNFMANINSLLEPVIMLFLGFIVGCFIIAMYLPIFKLSSLF